MLRLRHPVRAAWAALFAGLASAGFASEPPPVHDPVADAAVRIGDGVFLVPGGFAPGRQPDGNTVVFHGRTGLVVLDTGRHPAHSDAILAHASASGLPIVEVVNSHWHLDHVSGNPRLRSVFPALRVHATDAVDGALEGFLARSKQQAEAFLAQPGDAAMQAEVRADLATIDSGRAIAPDVVVATDEDVDWAGRRLHLGVERRAVTAGDVWIFDPATRTLAAGDLVTLPVPFLDTACPARWSAALGRLEVQDFEHLVPGHGPVLDRAQFRAWRHAFDSLVDCAGSEASADACREGWRRDAAGLPGAELDSPRTTGMLDYYLEVLRDPARRREACG